MDERAVCKFCGQTFYSDEKTEEGLMRAAIKQCRCAGAVAQAKKWERIDMAKLKLCEVLSFNPVIGNEEVYGSEEFAEVIEKKLEGFIEHLVDLDVTSLQVKISGVGKITMQVNGDGNIKIKKQVTYGYESKV